MKPKCVTIQMKAIEQYFHVVRFIMLYKVVLTFKSVDKSQVCVYGQCFYVVLFTVVITFESPDETLSSV